MGCKGGCEIFFDGFKEKIFQMIMLNYVLGIVESRKVE